MDNLSIKIQKQNHYYAPFPRSLLILQTKSSIMIIHNGFESLSFISPVVTLGIFDGVHMGHKVLLDRLVSRAKEDHGESVVITFSPHPRLVLDQNSTDLSFLTTMEEKQDLLERANIDHLVIIEFTKKFSKIEACDFIRDILVKKIGTKHLIIGFNHHFGRRGKGDYMTISKCAESLDFKVEQVEGFHSAEGVISSSSIREALLNGLLDEANRWLGYSYSVSGTIVQGRKIGRSIGFPTANINPLDKFKLIPSDGVYAVEVRLDGLVLPGMLSIGSNPTVNSNIQARTIEVNILDFDKDIYGRDITVIFRKWLREEIKFENTEQLAEQMKLDKQHVLQLLQKL
jgi:riboflavin kinase/FMN adenylyltransferase